MAIISTSSSHFPVPCYPVYSRSSRRSSLRTRGQFSCRSTSMDSGDDQLRAKFMEFPYVCGPQRNLMVELISSVESRMGASLQACTLPPDVQHFENGMATAEASLHLRSGLPSSQIDVILGCWVHCKLPSGGVFNTTSLSAYLKPSTKAPHFLLDIIQTTPTSLVLLLDVTPRKDLNLFPDYLKTYYEDTQLDRHRQKLIQTLMAEVIKVKPYISPSLYLRALLSPTAILHAIDSSTGTDQNGKFSIEEIIERHVGPIAKEMLQFWMDQSEKDVGEISDSTERACLAERDRVIKNTTIFDDLGSKFPGLFGQDVADRVLGVLKEYYVK